MAERDVIVRIRAIDEASAVFNRVALAAGAFVSVWAIQRGVTDATEAFIAAEASSITLAAALRATGEAAGFTTDELEDYAEELMRLTTVDDDAFKRIMGIMATFRNVSGAVFKESIELIADMSVQFGGLESGAIRLGKALNDPVKGMTALSRVGIQFSETQKKQIEAFVEANDLMSAQQIILDELTNQFGGQARAQVDSFGGSVDQLGNAFGEAMENAGEFIAKIPYLIEGIKVATVVFENFGLVVEREWLDMQLGAIGLYEGIKHIFTVQIPEVFDWFLQNWIDMLLTAESFIGSIFENIARNIWNAIQAIKGWQKFEWTPLLEGFENTIEKLPELTKRVMTDVEKEILAKLRLTQDKFWDLVAEKLVPVPSKEGTGPPGMPLPGEDDADKKARARRRGGFGELVRFGANAGRDDSRRAITLAEKAGRMRERQDKHLERTAELMEQLVNFYDPTRAITVTAFK